MYKESDDRFTLADLFELMKEEAKRIEEDEDEAESIASEALQEFVDRHAPMILFTD